MKWKEYISRDFGRERLQRFIRGCARQGLVKRGR